MFRPGSLLAVLHEATHNVPGVPDHVERAPGVHQRRQLADRGRTVNRRWNHSAARPPRVLIGWQRRIATLFGRQLP